MNPYDEMKKAKSVTHDVCKVAKSHLHFLLGHSWRRFHWITQRICKENVTSLQPFSHLLVTYLLTSLIPLHHTHIVWREKWNQLQVVRKIAKREREREKEKTRSWLNPKEKFTYTYTKWHMQIGKLTWNIHLNLLHDVKYYTLCKSKCGLCESKK